MDGHVERPAQDDLVERALVLAVAGLRGRRAHVKRARRDEGELHTDAVGDHLGARWEPAKKGVMHLPHIGPAPPRRGASGPGSARLVRHQALEEDRRVGGPAKRVAGRAFGQHRPKVVAQPAQQRLPQPAQSGHVVAPRRRGNGVSHQQPRPVRAEQHVGGGEPADGQRRLQPVQPREDLDHLAEETEVCRPRLAQGRGQGRAGQSCELQTGRLGVEEGMLQGDSAGRTALLAQPEVEVEGGPGAVAVGVEGQQHGRKVRQVGLPRQPAFEAGGQTNGLD
jgi:hypothetical protein